jgi:hypothetical protein
MSLSISALRGHVVSKVEGGVGDDALIFHLDDGRRFKMHHEQDCCESVYLSDVEGNLDDLESLIISAEESTNSEVHSEYGESGLWTFYRFQTAHGYVVLRWVGYSDYYSLGVDFEEITNKED